MKNRLLAAAVLAGCALLMTGCGEKGKNHLEIFSTKMENQAILQSFIDDYTQEHPGVTIEFNSPPDASTV
ncbi:MAG: carbohydrate ABC transporter substrate-binding protein, partial [Blautia coccoides]